VQNDLLERVDCIVDGGESNIGVESTVIDLTVQPAVLLRPGGISFEQLQQYLPDIVMHPHLLGQKSEKIVKSPGMKYRHYAPDTRLELFSPETQDIQELIEMYQKE
jgi:L-threonylcarbamoyladenylate synthase